LRQDALAVINRSVTARAWLTGYYIVEYEQHGADRAKYGEGLLKKLAARLSGAAFALASLKNYRRFYLLYPELGEPVAGYLLSHFGKGQSLIGQLAIDVGDATQKSQSAISLSRGDSLLVESGDALKISPDVLFNRLSFTHILRLLPLADDLQRTFYAFEAIRGTWSVRELQRQIESLYYARSGWSKNPRKLAQLTHVKAEKLNAADFVKADAVLYADAAQLGVYLGYYHKHVMQADDNPPVGILLCTAAGEEMMEFVNTFVDPRVPSTLRTPSPLPTTNAIVSWISFRPAGFRLRRAGARRRGKSATADCRIPLLLSLSRTAYAEWPLP
jgi:hypothetical protein